MQIQEHLEQLLVEQEILGHVREALMVALRVPIEAGAAAIWHERVCFLFDSFHRHLRRWLRVADEGRFLDEIVVARRPTLARRADGIRGGYMRLADEFDGIHAEARAVRVELLANLCELQQRLIGFLTRLAHHQQAERELVYEATQVDIGGEG